MKALTVRQPWASLIIEGVKDVENRTWSTNYRGPLLIHAGKAVERSAWTSCLDIMPAGCIIGMVDLIDCVTDSSSEWAEADSFHWLLADPRPCEPTPMKGKLGLWTFESPRIALQRPHSPLEAGRLAS